MALRDEWWITDRPADDADERPTPSFCCRTARHTLCDMRDYNDNAPCPCDCHDEPTEG